MKKKIFAILLLVLILTPFSKAFAQYGVDVKLIEPENQTSNIGDKLTYRLDIKFTENLKNFKNLFITLRLDDALDYESSEITGVNGVPGTLEVVSKENDQGRKGFMTVRLTNLDALNGQTSFSVKATTKVNKAAKIGQKINNQITASFQKEGQVNDAKYFEFYQESNFLIGKEVSPKPNEGTDNKPTQPEKPVEPIKDPFINVRTGDIYASFMREIEGKTNPGTTLRVVFPDGQKDFKVEKDGSFLIPLDKEYKEDLTINSLQGASVLTTKTLKYVDEYTFNDQYLNSAVTAMKSFGDTEIIDKILAEYKTYTDQMSIIIGVEGGTYQEMYFLFQRLYDATKPANRPASTHKAFMNGYPDGSFLPGAGIKRSETAAILSRIIAGGEVADKSSRFPDVPSYEWYKKYIGHMEELGLMKGYEEDGTFRPDRKISRAEFATIVSRYLKLSQKEAVYFPDLPSDHWAMEDIMKVVAAGIMQGYPDGTFDPQRPVTRAEAATIINRMLNRIPDEAYIKKNKVSSFSDIRDHWAYYQIIEATYTHSYTRVSGREQYK